MIERAVARLLRGAVGVVALSIGLSLGGGELAAQDSLKIVAVVNEDAISAYDLAQRISLVVAFSNLPDTIETRQRIAGDVLNRLITEKLHMQEAKRIGIEIDDNEIAAAIAKMERDNNKGPGEMEEFLKSVQIDPDTLKQQIRSDIEWVRVINDLFRPLNTVSEAEVDEVLNEIRKNAGKPEYLLGEIFLPLDGKTRGETESMAGRIHAQLVAGASFPQLAQNFSQSTSASRGGDMGWTTPAELDPVVAATVARMKAGEISPPITTDDGVFIIYLRQIRAAPGLETGSPGKTTVTLQQLHLAIQPGASAGQIASASARASELAAGTRSCDDLGKVAASQGSPLSGPLGTFELSQLSPLVRGAVENLAVSTPSQPLRTADGVAVMMVCERKSEAGADPVTEARTRIRTRLLNDRLSRAADQHMAKIRRQAFIEVRL